MNEQSKKAPKWDTFSTIKELERALAEATDFEEASCIRELLRYKKIYGK